VFAGAADDDESFTSAPSGFTNLVNTLSGGGTNNSAEVGSARQYDAATNKDPSSFTLTGSESWAAMTMFVQAKGSIRQIRGFFYQDAVPINTPAYDGDALSKRRRFT